MKPPARPSPKDKRKHSPRGKPAVAQRLPRLLSFLVFAFAFLLYANTLGHGYVLDDDVVFVKNKDVQAGYSGIKSILSHSFIYGFTGHNDQSYRPLVSIVFAIEKEWFGNNPFAGHFINVFLFALSCVLLFRIVCRLFPDLGPALPLAAALLFAAHPVHTEAVANIKGRDDILNFLFFGMSLYYLLKHVDGGIKKHFILSVLFFFGSLLCKEMAVTFLAAIPLTVFFFRQVPVRKILAGIIPFAGAFLLYMLIRSSVLDAVTFEEKMKVVNNGLAAATTASDRIATAILILGKYLGLLIYPHPLSWDYSFNQIPIVSFGNGSVLSVIILFTGLILLAGLRVWNRFKNAASPPNLADLTAYAVLFFLITISVVSNIFILIGSTMGERFLFVPSMGFCLLAAGIFYRLGSRRAGSAFELAPAGHPGKTGLLSSVPPLMAGVLIPVLGIFSYLTFERNKDWKDNLSLFESGVIATPNSSRAQSALGSAYREMAEKEPNPMNRGELYGKAITLYQKAADILPENTEALYNLGVCYYAIGDRESARKIYLTTLNFSPEQANAANNLGVLFFEDKKYEEARKYFEQSVKYMPGNSDAWGNMGAIEHNLGNLSKAVEYYQRSLSINPANQNVQGNLQKAQNSLKAKPAQP